MNKNRPTWCPRKPKEGGGDEAAGAANRPPAARPPPSPWAAAGLCHHHLVVPHADAGPDVVVSGGLLLALRLEKQTERGVGAGVVGFPREQRVQPPLCPGHWPARCRRAAGKGLAPRLHLAPCLFQARGLQPWEEGPRAPSDPAALGQCSCELPFCPPCTKEARPVCVPPSWLTLFLAAGSISPGPPVQGAQIPPPCPTDLSSPRCTQRHGCGHRAPPASTSLQTPEVRCQEGVLPAACRLQLGRNLSAELEHLRLSRYNQIIFNAVGSLGSDFLPSVAARKHDNPLLTSPPACCSPERGRSSGAAR